MKLTPHNIVLDIETLSTKPNAAICSIGAVPICLETGALRNPFYMNVDWKESRSMAGLPIAEHRNGGKRRIRRYGKLCKKSSNPFQRCARSSVGGARTLRARLELSLCGAMAPPLTT